MNCSNCETTVQDNEGMHLSYNGGEIACLCMDCLYKVSVGKLVFRKNGSTYTYDAYLPVETEWTKESK